MLVLLLAAIVACAPRSKLNHFILPNGYQGLIAFVSHPTVESKTKRSKSDERPGARPATTSARSAWTSLTVIAPSRIAWSAGRPSLTGSVLRGHWISSPRYTASESVISRFDLLAAMWPFFVCASDNAHALWMNEEFVCSPAGSPISMHLRSIDLMLATNSRPFTAKDGASSLSGTGTGYWRAKTTS
jgi:hypothetical protein